MKTSLGSWLPAESYFSDQNLKLKGQLTGYSQARLQSKPSCGCWVWLFCPARPQRGAQGIPLTQSGPARQERESWMGARWPHFPASLPRNHRQRAVLPGEGMSCPGSAPAWLRLPGCPPHALPPSGTGLRADTLQTGQVHKPPSKPTYAKAQAALGSAQGWGREPGKGAADVYLCGSPSPREPLLRKTVRNEGEKSGSARLPQDCHLHRGTRVSQKQPWTGPAPLQADKLTQELRDSSGKVRNASKRGAWPRP